MQKKKHKIQNTKMQQCYLKVCLWVILTNDKTSHWRVRDTHISKNIGSGQPIVLTIETVSCFTIYLLSVYSQFFAQFFSQFFSQLSLQFYAEFKFRHSLKTNLYSLTFHNTKCYGVINWNKYQSDFRQSEQQQKIHNIT